MKQVPKKNTDEALIKALFEIPKYDNTKSNIFTWVIRIAKNLSIADSNTREVLESYDKYLQDEETSTEDKKQLLG